MPIAPINPNADKAFIDGLDLSNQHNFPKFLKSIQLKPFRHIADLTVNFNHPISVIAGTNRSGKSTILMALACSHFDFNKRNGQNGRLERHTWSSLMQFTEHDKQLHDWTYQITYKLGTRIETKRGQRKAATNKWNGIGKKESQFKDRQVIFVDLDRILPARNFSRTAYYRARRSTTSLVSAVGAADINRYLSYILEQTTSISKLASHLDKDVFKYTNGNEYSSYNAATGEDVLTKILIDVVEAKSHSLVLIDEIEIGLHPKVQRRLVDILYHIARNEKKQFILTTHSPSILASVPDSARSFIEKLPDGTYKCIENSSVNACLSKMDSFSYPLFDLYCEDDVASLIIQKAVNHIQRQLQLSGFAQQVNIIISGAADRTFAHFLSHKETYPKKRQKTGYACVLDGDRKSIVSSNGTLSYPAQECLHFLHSNEAPEKFLVRSYVAANPNQTLDYHLDNTNPHALFDKIIENSTLSTKSEVFEACWSAFVTSTDGQSYRTSLCDFLIDVARKFSPDM